MKRWLQNDFLRPITLRFIEACRWFWFAKDVGHAVIADAVARTEISVRVVVKGAPTYATGILRVRRQLIVNAGMAQGVLREALNVVDGLGRISMSDKLRIQIARMVGRLQ